MVNMPSIPVSIESIVGEVLTYIDCNETNTELLLTTASGRRFRIYHNQDCCETVQMEGTDGKWDDLIGKVVIEATQEEKHKGNPPPEYPESWTRTTITFRVNDATVISRWIGQSNGCYSESVDIAEITSKFSR